MNKKIINAVRTYLIEDNKIVVINYKNHDMGYYDIPGGKIENNETYEETSIRKFKEETGITIIKQHCIGHCTIEYPDRIYEMNIFIVDNYKGNPVEVHDNKAMWINIDDILKKKKVFSTIEVIKYLKKDINIKIQCNENHNVLKLVCRDSLHKSDN